MPVDIRVVGPVARASMPVMKQLFIARMSDTHAFERTLFMIRKRAGKMCSAKGYGDDFYVASLLVEDRRLQGPHAPRAAHGLLP